MSAFLDDEERENLESLKQDLVGPLKRFTQEVREDTVGDARRFYAAQARRAAQNAKLARQKTAEKMARLRREQEQLQKRRKQLMKRAAITLALLAVLSAVILSLALYAHAEAPERPRSEIEYMGIGLTQQESASGLSLRTSDRCHWCGNPYSQRQGSISELLSASGGRIATPVCALARNDRRKLIKADTHNRI